MGDNYFVRPHAAGPALEITEGVSGHVLITTAPGASVPRVVLQPRHVEEVCRAMYRMAGMAWPGHPEECHGEVCYREKGLSGNPVPCPTRWTEEECAGTVGHPGPCTPNADDIPSEQEREPAPLRLGERVAQLETAMDQAAADAAQRDTHMEYHDRLTRRLENLEQTSAGGAATDDMFAAQSRRLDALEDRLVSGERLGDIVNLLTEIRDRLPAPPPEPCGSISPNQLYECDQPIGHAGRHEFSDNGSYRNSWPDAPGSRRCRDQLTIGGTIRCTLLDGHDGVHQNATQGARWPNPCREDAMCKLSAGHPGTHQLTDL